MAFLALRRELQFLIEFSALFQALVESFKKVLVALEEIPSSISFPFEIDLELLIPSFSSVFLISKLLLGTLTIFHISVGNSGHCPKLPFLRLNI